MQRNLKRLNDIFSIKLFFPRNEDGFLLVITMVMLVLLTLIGLSATQLSRIELQIAGNDRMHKETIGGLMGLPYQGFYAASKFAVEGLSESLRMELIPYHIKVIVIQPGDFFTSFTANRKPVLTEGDDSPYKTQFEKTLSIIEKDEKGGLKPEFLARKLAKILTKKNPCHSYIIATLEQKFAVVLKRILPGSLFSSILSSHYGIK